MRLRFDYVRFDSWNVESLSIVRNEICFLKKFLKVLEPIQSAGF